MCSSYRAVNTFRLGYKNQLVIHRKVIAVWSEIHTKHINHLCGQNVGFLNVLFGINSNHYALQGRTMYIPLGYMFNNHSVVYASQSHTSRRKVRATLYAVPIDVVSVQTEH